MKSHNNRNNNNKLENFQNEVSKFFEDKEFIEYFEIFQKITDDLTQKVKTKDFDEANRKEIQKKIEELKSKYSSNSYVKKLEDYYKGFNNKETVLYANDKLNSAYQTYINHKSTGDEDKKNIVSQQKTTLQEFNSVLSLLNKNEGFKSALKGKNNSILEIEFPDQLQQLKTLHSIYLNASTKQKQFLNVQFNKQLCVTAAEISNWFGIVPDKILSGTCYQDNYIEALARDIIGKNGLSKESYEYIHGLTLTQLNEEHLNRLKTQLIKENKTIFISYKVSNDVWASICLLVTEGKIKVLYKNSLGGWADELKEVFLDGFLDIENSFNNEDFIIHSYKEQNQTYDSAPMMLKNLEIISEKIKNKEVDELINNFENIKFCEHHQIHEIRKKHNDILKEIENQNITESNNLLSQITIDLASLKKEDKLLDINTEQDFIDKADEAIRLNPQNSKPLVFKSKLLIKFAKIKADIGEYQKAYNLIIQSKTLSKIDSEDLEFVQKIENKFIPVIKTNTDNKKLIEQIKSLNSGISEEELNFLEDNLTKIQELIPKFAEYTESDISTWARKIKSSPNDADICEYIAMIDRANNIDTIKKYGALGHHLRDTQIASALSFLNVKGNGRLDQIKTGEGKTTIVAVLAIIRALQGQKVDIITSSDVLARSGAEEKGDLLKMFGLKVMDNRNDPSYTHGPKECYSADILYGSISNFQFDLLKHEHQGLETRGKKNLERSFDTVIVDEVDSMLIDNGSHLAKLSGPLPGMEYLQSLLVYIFVEVNKYSETIRDLIRDSGHMLDEIKDFKELKEDVIKKVRHKIESLNQPDLSYQNKTEDSAEINTDNNIEIFIPKHLKDYSTDQQIEKWVSHAFNANVMYKKDREYTIKEKDGEKVISPIDYNNTGSIQTGTIWSDGLHQFLQIKHGLRLTSESCNTSFISNVGYIRRYIKDLNTPTPKIFGLTGTLGGEKEKALLSKSYEGLDFLSIPTFKEKIFKELPGKLLSSEDEWLNSITESIIEHSETRGVLVICETIDEANSIHESLLSKKGDLEFKLYLEESHASVTEKKIDKGEVIIATNLAGRGTDIRTTDIVEDNGGLHVCVTFLPCNQRVEDQAFGRTSRQGKKGTAELIIKETKLVKEVKNLCDKVIQDKGISPDETQYFQMLKKARDLFEDIRVDNVAEKRLVAINLGDELFDEFSKLCKQLKEENEDIYWFYFTIKAIEERWGFWLKKLDLNGLELIDKKDVKSQFNEFKNSIKKEFSAEGNKGANSLSVIKNPYYLIAIGEICFQVRDFENAKTAFKKALELDDNLMILATAHYLLAFTEIELSKAVENILARASKALVPFLSVNGSKRDEAVKNSKFHLDKAKTGLDSIKKFYTGMYKECVKIAVLSQEALLHVHLESKINLLSLFGSYTEANKKSIEDLKADKQKGYIAIKSITQFKLGSIDFGSSKEDRRMSDQLKSSIKESEIRELAAIGLGNIFQANKVMDIPNDITIGANAQVAVGIIMYGAAACFPPAALVLTPLASVAVSEGVADIIVALVQYSFRDDTRPFNPKEFGKQKAISIGISLTTAGIGALAKIPSVLNQGIKACQKISKTLKSGSGVFSKMGNFMAKRFDKLASTLEKLKYAAEFNKLDKIGKIEYLNNLEKANKLEHFNKLGGVAQLNALKNAKDLTKLESFGHSVGGGLLSATKGAIVSTAIQEGSMYLLKESTGNLKEKIKTSIEVTLNSKISKETLSSVSEEKIYHTLSQVMSESVAQIIENIAKSIFTALVNMTNNWKVKLTAVLIDSAISVEEISTAASNICDALNLKLQNLPVPDNKNNSVYQIKDKIAEQIAESIYGKVLALTNKVAISLPSIGYQAVKGNLEKKKNNQVKKQPNKEQELNEELQRLNNMADGISEYNQQQAAQQSKIPTRSEKISTAAPVDLESIKSVASAKNIPLEIRDKDGKVIFRNKNAGTKELPTHLVYSQGESGVGHINVVEAKTGNKISITQSGEYTCGYDALGYLSHKPPQKIYHELLNLQDTTQSFWDPEYGKRMAGMMEGARQGLVSPQEFTEQQIKLQKEYYVSGVTTGELKDLAKQHFKDINDEHAEFMANAAYQKILQSSVTINLNAATLKKVLSDGSVKSVAELGQESELRNGRCVVESIIKEEGKSIIKEEGKKDQGIIYASLNIHNDPRGGAPQYSGAVTDSTTSTPNYKATHIVLKKGDIEKISMATKTDSLQLYHRLGQEEFRQELISLIPKEGDNIADKIDKDAIDARVFADRQQVNSNPKGYPEVQIMLNTIPMGSIEKVVVDYRDGEEYIKEIKHLCENQKIEVIVINPDDKKYQFSGQGTEEYKQPSYWNEYSKKAMKNILKLRLECLDLVSKGIKIIDIKYAWTNTYMAGLLFSQEMADNIFCIKESEKFVIPLNLYSKHWVGVILEKHTDRIKLTYLDPENNEPPKQLIEDFRSSIELLGLELDFHRIEVEAQRSNNCGPEVIEDFILYLTGERIEQDKAVAYHSELVENMLLGCINCSSQDMMGS